jgi:hypothetical protein
MCVPYDKIFLSVPWFLPPELDLEIWSTFYKLNIVHIIWMGNDREFVFYMRVPCDKTFYMYWYLKFWHLGFGLGFSRWLPRLEFASCEDICLLVLSRTSNFSAIWRLSQFVFNNSLIIFLKKSFFQIRLSYFLSVNEQYIYKL